MGKSIDVDTLGREKKKIMALSIQRIMNQLSPNYRVRLVAGKKGIDRTDIYWVSLVEDYGTEKFKNINEIVITSCVNGTGESLLEFAKNLYLAKGRALMVNVGKYIKEMPKELIAFCNEVDLPLYAIPWDVLMSDVVKDISHILMYDEVKNISITELMQSILFQTKSMESQIGKLPLYGFSAETQFCPMILQVGQKESKDFDLTMKSIRVCCEKAAEVLSLRHVFFVYNKMAVLVLAEAKREELEQFVSLLKENVMLMYTGQKIGICVGKVGDTVDHLAVNFKRLLPLLNVVEQQEDQVLFYDDMGVFKILVEVNDTQVLKEMFSETMGVLQRYDKENNTDLMDYIRAYIQNDGNVQTVAGLFFVHRNTVNNQLRKVRELTGINPLTLEGKLRFSMGLKIKELFGW